MTPTTRLTTALRAIADALEGNGRHPLPCSDPEMPARRLLELYEGDNADVETLWWIAGAILKGGDPIDVLCNFGLCDE